MARSMRRTAVIETQRGFTIIEIVIGLGLLGITVLAIASIITFSAQQVKMLEMRSERNEIKNLIQSTFAETSVCSCNFSKPTTPNAVNAPNLTFNSNFTDGSQFMSLKKIYAGCNATDPILIEEGKPLSSGLKAGSIRLENLRPTGVPMVWIGDLAILWALPSSGAPLSKTKITYRLRVDSSTPGQSVIQACLNDTLGLATVGSCSAGNYLAGFNSEGEKLCLPIPVASQTQVPPPNGPYPQVNAAQRVVSGTGGILFPLYNATGGCNRIPYTCSGSYQVDTTGSNWSSQCSTGWTPLGNCRDASGNLMPGCPMIQHPTTGAACTQ